MSTGGSISAPTSLLPTWGLSPALVSSVFQSCRCWGEKWGSPRELRDVARAGGGQDSKVQLQSPGCQGQVLQVIPKESGPVMGCKRWGHTWSCPGSPTSAVACASRPHSPSL